MKAISDSYNIQFKHTRYFTFALKFHHIAPILLSKSSWYKTCIKAMVVLINHSFLNKLYNGKQLQSLDVAYGLTISVYLLLITYLAVLKAASLHLAPQKKIQISIFHQQVKNFLQ